MRRAAHRYHHPPVVSPANGSIGCNGKRSYPNKTVADGHAQRTRNSTDDRVNAYRCRHCAWWHVGTPQFPRPTRRPRVEMEDLE